MFIGNLGTYGSEVFLFRFINWWQLKQGSSKSLDIATTIIMNNRQDHVILEKRFDVHQKMIQVLITASANGVDDVFASNFCNEHFFLALYSFFVKGDDKLAGQHCFRFKKDVDLKMMVCNLWL